MKRMELQSFYLKLSELKDYDQAKLERQDGSKDESTVQQAHSEKPITKPPKTKQEVQTRIGLNMNTNT